MWRMLEVGGVTGLHQYLHDGRVGEEVAFLVVLPVAWRVVFFLGPVTSQISVEGGHWVLFMLGYTGR